MAKAIPRWRVEVQDGTGRWVKARQGGSGGWINGVLPLPLFMSEADANGVADRIRAEGLFAAVVQAEPFSPKGRNR